MRKIRFALVGSGWRSLFYHRIAMRCPERFDLTGMLVRTEEKREKMRAEGIPATLSRAEILAANPDFVVLAVSTANMTEEIENYIKLGVPVLAETPPTNDIEKLTHLWEVSQRVSAKVLVAEQYYHFPMHAAQLAVIQAGLLGNVYHAYVSTAHDFHGVSLLRHFLGDKGEAVEVRSRRYTNRIAETGTRTGLAVLGGTVKELRRCALLEFEGGKTALYDFASAQYLSLIRSRRVTAYGERGELSDDTVRYVSEGGTIAASKLVRLNDTISEDLAQICLGERMVYQNPFPLSRMTDDEIAIASRLCDMASLIETGKAEYQFAETLQNCALTSLIHQAGETGTPLRSGNWPWLASLRGYSA